MAAPGSPEPPPPAPPADAPPAKPAARNVPDHVKLVAYPKAVFLYPTLIGSLIAALWLTFSPAESPAITSLMS